MFAILQHGQPNIFEWTNAPSVWIGFGLLTLAYILLTGPIRAKQAWGAPPSPGQQAAFHIATLVAILGLVSPLDHLGDEYLFSAHMVQHLLLMFVSAPLWLVGMPDWLMQVLVPERFESLAHFLTRPVTAAIIFTAAMSIWHVPYLYNLTLEYDWLHIIEHLTYMIAAVIGWWPIAGPTVSFASRPTPPARMLYEFFLALPCTVIAAILTFSNTPLYPFYATAPRIVDLSAIADQQLGGLLMWIPTHMILLLAFSVTFFIWFNTSNQTSEEMLPNPR